MKPFILSPALSLRRKALKTYRSFFFIVAVLFGGGLIYAQTDTGPKKNPDNWSSYSYRNIAIEKIYPHQLGYVISYRKGPSEFANAYLPLTWFAQSAGKGELIHLGIGKMWPYLTVYFKDDKFSHVRLYVRDYSHSSWGRLPINANLDSNFDVEEVLLEY